MRQLRSSKLLRINSLCVPMPLAMQSDIICRLELMHTLYGCKPVDVITMLLVVVTSSESPIAFHHPHNLMTNLPNCLLKVSQRFIATRIFHLSPRHKFR